MHIAGRKLWEYLPRRFQPAVRRAGREQLRVRHAMRGWLLEFLASRSAAIEHVLGPATIHTAPADLVVVAMVRNALAHLPAFLSHYERLGARHIVLLDNGSTDGTVELASSHARISIYRTELAFARYELVLKRWLARFGGSGWTLVADADELFDYPFSREVSLHSFLEYLNDNGYDAVCAQNLEMVPDESLLSYQGVLRPNLEESHRFYDLTDYERLDDEYWIRMNEIDFDQVRSHTGGIWEAFFGYKGAKLTKQPLFRASSRIQVFPYDVHFVTRARIADVTGLFRHYKYTGMFLRHVAEELERKQHYRNAEIFAHYRSVLQKSADLTFVRPTSREFGGAEDLLASGFLVASERYMRFVQACRDSADRQAARRLSGRPGDAESRTPPVVQGPSDPRAMDRE